MKRCTHVRATWLGSGLGLAVVAIMSGCSHRAQPVTQVESEGGEVATGPLASPPGAMRPVDQVALGTTPIKSSPQDLPMPPGKPNPQMQAVLDAAAMSHPTPVESLSTANARELPTPADAVRGVLAMQNKPAAVEAVGNIVNRPIPGADGPILARVYTPKGTGPFPVLVYFHGGGWVIADLDAYDASARALTNAANAVVVSVAYRQAPTHKFPAAANDAFAAYQWALDSAASIGGDPARVAVGGESAGGNLAAVVSLMARDKKVKLPVYQLLVYPITDYNFDTESYHENAHAKFLSKPAMQWFFDKYLRTPADGENPYVSPLRADIQGLPPATVITDQIDPLRSEGKAYADKLRDAGVQVQYKNFDGVTHEFFGMAAVVDEAKEAQQFAAAGLKEAFRAP